jgi:HEAT repeat protein
MPEGYVPDADLRIQALGHLIRTEAQRAIPMLREIALEAADPRQARSAVFVLAQSSRPEARDAVVEVASSAPPPVRLAAVREMARFGGPEISKQLLQVYSTADVLVKRQIVKSLGERAEKQALISIVRSERDDELCSRAIMTLGDAGGSQELRGIYMRVRKELKPPIIKGLFNARAEDELIRIAERESDGALRDQAVKHLRLLGTPKAKEFLLKVSEKR